MFYGREACGHFPQMAEYWSKVLDAQDWNNFLFVLIDSQQDKPVLDVWLSANCWQLPMDTLCCAGKPVEIIKKIRERICDGYVMVQCICSMTDNIADSEHLISWLNSLQEDFEEGTVLMITYLILHCFPNAGLRQKAFGEPFYANRYLFPFLYLLSDCAMDQSSVPEPSIWRALYGELLANHSVLRVLKSGSLYSLGFSTLNANGSELQGLRRYLTGRWFMEKALKELKPADAWRILIGDEFQTPGAETHELRLTLHTWLENTVSRRMVFPDAAERKNNRILNGLYNRPPEEAQTHIKRFYQLNGGGMDAARAAAGQFAADYIRGVVSRLRRTVNVPSFPMKLLDRVITELTALSVERQDILLPPWEKRRFLFFRARRNHFDRYLDTIEKTYERASRSRLTALYAKAMADALAGIRPFIEEAKSLNALLTKELLPDHVYGAFAAKYCKYVEHLQESILRLPDNSEPEGIGESYYDEAGAPLIAAFRASIESVSDILCKSLPEESAGKFCQTVCWEYGTQERLHDFLSKYLAQSKRMFFEPADVPDDPHSLYYTDKKLADHPWFRDKTVIDAGNDNVERVDLFQLKNNLGWYLENNRCFRSTGEATEVPSSLKLVFEPQKVQMQSTLEEQPGSFLMQDSPPTYEQAPEHNLAIHIEGKMYVLVWDWDITSPNALVRISQNGRIIATINCSSEQYYSPVGGIPNGIDITSGLPYGGITVEVISTNRRLYARRDMAGRKNRVTYKLERNKNGAVLIVQCSSSDLAVLAVCAPRVTESEKNIFYPLGTACESNSYRYTGLKLADLSKCSLIPSPEGLFPTVYTVRI